MCLFAPRGIINCPVHSTYVSMVMRQWVNRMSVCFDRWAEKWTISEFVRWPRWGGIRLGLISNSFWSVFAEIEVEPSALEQKHFLLLKTIHRLTFSVLEFCFFGYCPLSENIIQIKNPYLSLTQAGPTGSTHRFIVSILSVVLIVPKWRKSAFQPSTVIANEILRKNHRYIS